MNYDIPARSRLVPTIPITSPQFVYRRARETDVQATFARVRAELERMLDERGARAKPPASTQSPESDS